MNGPPSRQPMTMTRFARIVECYGANPRAWPEGERDAAQALLAASDEAKALCRSEAELDSELEKAASMSPSDALRSRILAGIPVRERSLRDRLDGLAAALWPFGGVWRPAVVLAAAAALGIAVGAWLPYEQQTSDDTTTASDVSELVFAGYAYSGDDP
jgi:anti-sigma-K factor RskA